MPKRQTTRLPSPLPLMELTSGFWIFKTLAVADHLDLFGLVARSRGVTSATLAATLGIADRPAEMLLTGCAALGLLRKRGGRYRNMVETTGGRNYTAAEYSHWLKDIGFRKIRTVRFAAPGADGAVIGIKP